MTAETLDTVTLLQDEVARLEGELRARDEALREDDAGMRAEPFPAALPLAAESEAAEEGRRRISELNSDLAGREETIALLLEQVRLLEEAEEANRAEWEQIRQWVQEVERRVDRREETGQDFEAELEAERRRSETLGQDAERDRRLGEVQRGDLEKEVERLRAMLANLAGRADSPAAALAALEQENCRLREEGRDRARDSAAAAEVETLRGRIQAIRKERDDLKFEVQRARDDGQRERNEHEAALGSLRRELALESLKRQEELIGAGTAPPNSPALLEADERIRAFRQHLKEIHEDEQEQKLKRSLTARLSRLWHHTGPGR